ncbi:MAG: hypothetical protein KDE20_24350, partial [Caldilineaceae bacterium]|nr:hypothetical protein [Caldilineaceae bacterium]
DVEFQQEILDFGLMYRVIDQPTPRGGAAQGRNWTVDLFGGGRYVGIDLELRPALAEARSRDRDWLDPIVGVKTVVPLGERWRFILSGDVGGFGAESDFTSSATAVIGYDFRLFGADASALAGYRAITWDYSDGTGTDEFTWDVVQHGILLGLELRW